MNRPYDNIPRQGEHLGDDLDEKTTTNVRAQEPARPDVKEPTADAIYQCSYNESKGHHRIRRWKNESEITLGRGYKELRRVPEGDSVSDLKQDLPDEPHFVVFENLETGDVYFDRDTNLTDNWTGDGRFDQVTVFDDEDAAAEYVSSRQQ